MPDFQSITEHAKAIFTAFATDAGPDYWDWQPLAIRAFEAAEVFDAISEQRYAEVSPSKAQARIDVPQHPTPPKPQHSDSWQWQQQKWPPYYGPAPGT